MTISRPDSPSPGEIAAAAVQHAAGSSTPHEVFSARSSQEGSPVGQDTIEQIEQEVAKSSQKLLAKLGKLKAQAGSVRASIAGSSRRSSNASSSRGSIASFFARHPKTAEAGTQTDVVTVSSRRPIDYLSMVNITNLPPIKGFDNDSSVRSGQDDKMAERFADASAVLLPDALKNTVLEGYICNPGDLRIFINPDNGELGGSLLETNTSGWGNILAAPNYILGHVENTYMRLGQRLSAIPDPLVLIGSSGRAEYVIKDDPTSGLKDNTASGEKVWAADHIAGPLRETHGFDKVDVRAFDPKTFREVARDSGFRNNGKPTILVGYTQQFNEDDRMRVMDGVPYFDGRRIDAIVNERFVSNIEAKHGKLDRTKVIVGPMVNVGTNKALSYQATNKFNETIVGTGAYPICERFIPFTSCDNVDDMVEAIEALHAEGKGAIIKPFNTGWGHGIDTFRDPEESGASMRTRIGQSIQLVDEQYNKTGKVAGFPYTVTEYLPGSKITVPNEPGFEKYQSLNGYGPEMRIGAYVRATPNGSLELVATPSIVKLQHPSSKVANVSSQKAVLDVDASELMLPACNEQVIRMLGLTEAQVAQMTNWFARYMNSVLTDLHDAEVASNNSGKGKQRAV
jgi:hypothetical protein